MPNIVNTSVDFYEISDEGKAKFKELCRRFKDWKEDEYVSQFPLSEIWGLPESDDGPGSYNWNVDNMGSKWAFMEDPDDNGFRIESAWSCPFGALDYIAGQISEVDPNFVMTVRSQDEMPNWILAAVYQGEELFDSEEFEWEEIKNYMNFHDKDLAEHYNEEEEDWDDEGRDMMYDIVWECCDEMLYESMRTMLTSMEE
jgi:hypothetical protein